MGPFSCKWWFNSLPNDKISDKSELKGFADNKINACTSNTIAVDINTIEYI